MIITCPKCFDDYGVLPREPNPDGGYFYTCTNKKKHDPVGDYEWIQDPQDPTLVAHGSSDVGATSDLLNPFESIINGLPEAWYEYGVLDYELRLQYPDLFGRHVHDAGHRAMQSGLRSTASSTHFRPALTQLARRGVLQRRFAAATGAWAGGQISYWARASASAGTSTVTWQVYCEKLGRTAEWTQADRDEIANLAG